MTVYDDGPDPDDGDRSREIDVKPGEPAPQQEDDPWVTAVVLVVLGLVVVVLCVASGMYR